MQVVGTSDTTVSCVAVNDATLDGLLTVMICHRWAGWILVVFVIACLFCLSVSTLDGLLTVMICHRRAAAAFLGQLPPPALLLLLERPLILV